MRPKSIQFITYPNISLLDLAGPLDVFTAANRFSRPDHQPYTISILALNPTTEICSNFSINTEILQAETSSPHTLIIPGGPGIHDFCKDPKFVTHFINHADKAERLISVCTGIFALACAGKLDGRRATTHWSAYDELERNFPSIIIKRGPIFINDEHIWTSAGVTSGIDLALSIVEKDLGHSVALEVARHLVMFLKRPGDQNQFSSSLTLQSKSSQFSDLHAWINENLSTDLTVPVLANFMNMSERTFVRKYSESMEKSPSKMVELLRLDAARDMLTNSNNPLKTIAQRCGLGSESTLIRRFVKNFGITPKEHRARFKSTK
ncbi:DJ-1/PfpI family protein [Pseudomonas corrugata]|uniref:GlxA family transcriptional regulator n=1 Tax=Pseudomonas TaxID=286 RepID=UPI0005798CE4|nr:MULTISPECIES: DJ-1/PfpI family protein [Pseudomonas]MCD9114834.1 DJ-1/PfpI family protein [Pseudomonas bijieensis]MDD2030823.1 DJ-1/PfpI family protein [Pseudomonas sp. 39167]UZD97803.1 DJ-1/PfpI family protein [Pseudomonas corrugata]